MGCTVSKGVSNVVEVEVKSEITEVMNSDVSNRLSTKKSNDSISISSGSVQSDKSTAYTGSDILSSSRSRSVDFSRNGSAKSRTDPPTATATIIRKSQSNTSAEKRVATALLSTAETGTPSNVNRKRSTRRTSEIESDRQTAESYSSRRRSSDGDIGKVTRVTCIPPSLMQDNPLLKRDFSQTKPIPRIGPKNRHLTPTESQNQFFRLLDEKIAQGKDYYSEDERSITSVASRSLIPSGCGSSQVFPSSVLSQPVS